MNTQISTDLSTVLLGYQQEKDALRYKGGKPDGTAHRMIRQLVQSQGFVPQPYAGLVSDHPNKDDVRYVRMSGPLVEEFRDLYRGAEFLAYKRHDTKKVQDLLIRREMLHRNAAHAVTLYTATAGSALAGYAIIGGGEGAVIGSVTGLALSIPICRWVVSPLRKSQIDRAEHELGKLAVFRKGDAAVTASLEQMTNNLR
jgi:hypothetical protein